MVPGKIIEMGFRSTLPLSLFHSLCSRIWAKLDRFGVVFGHWHHMMLVLLAFGILLCVCTTIWLFVVFASNRHCCHLGPSEREN